MSHDHYLSPQKVKIKRRDGGLVLKMDGQCLNLAAPRRAVPLTAPDEFIALNGEDGREIGILRRLSDLEPDSRALLSDELAQIYRTIIIERVISVKRDPISGLTRWTVEIESDDADEPRLAVGVKPALGVKLLQKARAKSSVQDEEDLPGELTSGREVTFEIAGAEDVGNARYPRIFITDTQGRRYEIPNCEEMDLASRRLGERYF